MATNQKFVSERKRMDPAFIGIGTQKSASTSIYNYLTQHPQILRAKKNELHFFDIGYDQGIESYESLFPWHPAKEKNQYITGEYTPSYLVFTETAERIHRHYPTTKIIVCLRNPAIRAFSNWKMKCQKGLESRSFLEAVEIGIKIPAEHFYKNGLTVLSELMKNPYVIRGHYASQLMNYFKFFSRESIRVLFFGDVILNPQKAMNGLTDFLGCERFDGYDFQRYGATMPGKAEPEAFDRLDEYFHPHNQTLLKLLGLKQEPNW